MSAPSARFLRARAATALGVTQTLAWGATFYAPAMLADAVARDLGTEPSRVFLALSLALLAAGALGPWAGRWIDRGGGRRALVASNLVFAAGLLLMASAQGQATLFAAWALIGCGMAFGLYDAAFAALAAAFGREARGAIAGVTLIAGFASTLSWPLTGFAVEAFGWRGACAMWALLNLCVALPLNLAFAPPGAPPAAAGSVAPAPPAPRGAMAALAFVFAATWFTTTAMAAHLPRLLETAGATPLAALAAAAMVGPAQVGARMLDLAFLQRRHPILAARIAAATHPVGAAALLALGAPAAAAFTVLHGAGSGMMTIAKGALPLAMFGPAGYGRRLGLLMAPARVAQALAPALFAVAMERWGVGALGLTAALGLAALGALLLLDARPAAVTPSRG
jgi:predicted MFS family arabinose efflux permease